ncbi:MAG: alpha/beta hydrolase-fold protein [Ignavibacteria bacterium]|nr:alpha/beta hydrolase-fold protein [Ignavibacteria bacterium]
MKTRAVIVLILFLVVNAFAQDNKTENKIPPITINRTEAHEITSVTNGNLYPIYIALPGSYNYTKDNYPVVFMLDAYSSFGTMTQMVRLLAYNKELPELIVVGISSEGGSKEFNYNRMRDYTPTELKSEKEKLVIPVSGGGEKFLGFIKDELIPFVESKYRIKKDDKTFVGHSLGGLFVFYTLFREPNLFNKYVMISPALMLGDEFILKQEKVFAEKNKKLNVSVYTTVGSLEDSSFKEPWERLIGSMKEHKYACLKLKAEVSEKETHYTIIPLIATHGLKAVFEK